MHHAGNQCRLSLRGCEPDRESPFAPRKLRRGQVVLEDGQEFRTNSRPPRERRDYVSFAERKTTIKNCTLLTEFPAGN